MVHLETLSSGFHARILAARLGSAGIVTQLRGAVDGPYPVGDVLIYVDEADAELARQLMLADEVEAAFDPGPAPGRPSGRSSRALQLWLAAGVVILVAAASTVTRLL